MTSDGGGTQEVADQLAANAGSSGETKGRNRLEVLAGTLAELNEKIWMRKLNAPLVKDWLLQLARINQKSKNSLSF